jgi:phosphate acetyltransferase
MGFFDGLKQQARKDPKIVVLPELGKDKDGVMKEAIAIAKREGTAIPIGLTPELIEKTAKLAEFTEAFATARGYAKGTDAESKAKGVRMAERVVKRLPVEFYYAAMMIECGYAHGVVGGRYTTSADVALTAKLCIGEQEGQIVSSTFFREPLEGYPLFKLLACADMVVNQSPTAEQLVKIIVTSATTFETLAGREPKIALLSYITGKAQAVQMTGDPELKKIEEALELYAKGGYKWMLFQAQLDAALCPDVAKKKGAPFTEPADILVGPNLMQANPIYKALDRLVIGGSSMLVTSGFRQPFMDLSRGDTAASIANVMAACSVAAQKIEQKRGAKKLNEFFLKYAS